MAEDAASTDDRGGGASWDVAAGSTDSGACSEAVGCSVLISTGVVAVSVTAATAGAEGSWPVAPAVA